MEENNKIRMYTDVYTLLVQLPKEYIDKIPIKVKEEIASNMDNRYKYEIEDMLPESKALVVAIIRKYFENEEINKKIDKYIDFYQSKLNDRYNKQDIFKREKFKDIENIQKENVSLVEVKKHWYDKLIHILKKIIRIY